MNTDILTPEVQHYLREHETADPIRIALQKSPFPAVSSSKLAQQLDSRQRCRKKLPLWYHTPGIYYPEKLAVEQASSQATASYKSKFVPKGSQVIDLTGGFGVDTYYFAQRAKNVIHCERNIALAQVVRHNASELGLANVDFVVGDGLSYLQGCANDAADCIYIDPSRRVDKRKVFRLEDCEPNVIALQDWLLQKASSLIIKSAPLLDTSSALGVLEHVSEVHVISVGNECKELVFVLDRGFTGNATIVAVALAGEQANTFAFHLEAEQSAISNVGQPEQYLYEPDAALLKAGAFKLIGQRYGMKKLHQHTHLYTSTSRKADFMGRTFRIDDVMPYGDFKKRKMVLQANIATRNFPLKAEALRKKHRIHEGSDNYLFFCTGIDGALLVIFASKCE